MSEPSQGLEIGLDQLMELRGKTEAVASWLRAELEDRLETLQPLLAPKLLLGDHVRGGDKITVKKAERNFDALQEAYRGLAGEPLSLNAKLSQPLDAIPNQLVIHPWETEREVGDGKQRLTVRSPVAWTLLYNTPLAPAEARQMVAGRGSRDAAGLQKLALHALVIKMQFERNPGLVRLLGALRTQVEITTYPGLGKLPAVRLDSGIPSFCPGDEVMLKASKLSGASVFEELVDPKGLDALGDPLRIKLVQLIA